MTFRVTRRKASLPQALRTTFATYETARSAVRKWLRSTNKATGNPAISVFGFSIVTK